MNFTDFPGPNHQVLFERMMMDAIIWMITAVSVIALTACLLYVAGLIWLAFTETPPTQNRIKPVPPISKAGSYKGVLVMRNRVRLVATVGTFLAALAASQLLPELASLVSGR